MGSIPYPTLIPACHGVRNLPQEGIPIRRKSGHTEGMQCRTENDTRFLPLGAYWHQDQAAQGGLQAYQSYGLHWPLYRGPATMLEVSSMFRQAARHTSMRMRPP